MGEEFGYQVVDPLPVQATYRVGKHYEWVVGDSRQLCHGPGVGNKRLGDYHCRGDAPLLKVDAVVQTARGAGPSVPHCGDGHLAPVCHVTYDVRTEALGGSFLLVVDGAGQGVVLI